MINALSNTYHHQGVRGLWRGFQGSAAQMTTYSLIKDYLNTFEVRMYHWLFLIQVITIFSSFFFF